MQKLQNHGNVVSHNYKNVIKAVNENFVWRGVFYYERLKTDSNELWRIASGRMFRERGSATVKARSPNVQRRVAGARSAEDRECRWCCVLHNCAGWIENRAGQLHVMSDVFCRRLREKRFWQMVAAFPIITEVSNMILILVNMIIVKIMLTFFFRWHAYSVCCPLTLLKGTSELFSLEIYCLNVCLSFLESCSQSQSSIWTDEYWMVLDQKIMDWAVYATGSSLPVAFVVGTPV